MQASATPSTPSTPPRTPTWSESGHPSPALSYGSDSSDSTIMSSITSFEYQGIDYLALLWSEVNLIVAAIHIEANKPRRHIEPDKCIGFDTLAAWNGRRKTKVIDIVQREVVHPEAYTLIYLVKGHQWSSLMQVVVESDKIAVKKQLLRLIVCDSIPPTRLAANYVLFGDDYLLY